MFTAKGDEFGGVEAKGRVLKTVPELWVACLQIEIFQT
jgi:hypothetical protein